MSSFDVIRKTNRLHDLGLDDEEIEELLNRIRINFPGRKDAEVLQHLIRVLQKRLSTASANNFKRNHGDVEISMGSMLRLYIVQGGKCYYNRKIVLDFDREGTKSEGNHLLSLERIDQSSGYTIDNTVLCCLQYNTSKQMSIDILCELIEGDFLAQPETELSSDEKRKTERETFPPLVEKDGQRLCPPCGRLFDLSHFYVNPTSGAIMRRCVQCASDARRNKRVENPDTKTMFQVLLSNSSTTVERQENEYKRKQKKHQEYVTHKKSKTQLSGATNSNADAERAQDAEIEETEEIYDGDEHDDVDVEEKGEEKEKQAKKTGRKRVAEMRIDIGFLFRQYNKQRGRCFYSGHPLLLKPQQPFSASIERIDNAKDYTEDNCVLVCTIMQAPYVKWTRASFLADHESWRGHNAELRAEHDTLKRKLSQFSARMAIPHEETHFLPSSLSASSSSAAQTVQNTNACAAVRLPRVVHTPDDGINKCQFCHEEDDENQKGFSTFKALMFHKRCMHPETFITCPVDACRNVPNGKHSSFTEIHLFLSHYAQNHMQKTTDGSFRCPIDECNASYAGSSKLCKHILTKHSREDLFLCGEKFFSTDVNHIHRPPPKPSGWKPKSARNDTPITESKKRKLEE